jgi:hypothetical protein
MRRWPWTFTWFVRRVLRNSTTEYNLSTTLYGSCKLAHACIYWHTICILCHLELMGTVNQNFHHKVYCLPSQEATVVIIYLQWQIQLCSCLSYLSASSKASYLIRDTAEWVLPWFLWGCLLGTAVNKSKYLYAKGVTKEVMDRTFVPLPWQLHVKVECTILRDILGL